LRVYIGKEKVRVVERAAMAIIAQDGRKPVDNRSFQSLILGIGPGFDPPLIGE